MTKKKKIQSGCTTAVQSYLITGIQVEVGVTMPKAGERRVMTDEEASGLDFQVGSS